MSNYYGYGYRCGCERCRSRGLMGPAILVTLGVLFLLEQFDVARFHYTWPILLIVIGVVRVVQSSTSTEGHYVYGAPPTIPPPPAPPAQGSGQVHNG